MGTASPLMALLRLGKGTCDKVDLLDCGDEVLVRKQFRYMKNLNEAYALTILQGSGGQPYLEVGDQGAARHPNGLL